jgi:two-component system, OmpR family, sensor histidine kinase MtrB
VSRTLRRPPPPSDADSPGPASHGHPAPPSADRAWTARWRRPSSLRARATFAFAAVVLGLTAVLVAGVWLTVSSYLLGQRERATLAQTTANAGQVVRGLESGVLDAAQVLAQLPRETGSTSLLRTGADEWSTSSLRIGRDDLPEELRNRVVEGSAAMQRIDVDGTTMLAIGIPLAGQDGAYFEIYSLAELDNTYRVLGIVLAVAVITVVPVSVLIGWRVTRPALRPLDRLAAAAAAIADGDLHTRIDPRGDPSLVPLAASFNQTAAALEERLRSDARFAADVSHELRSPLTTMLNAAALVEAYRDRLPPDGQEGLDLLRSEVRNFERLVADLLEISRADAGSADAALETVRLVDLVRATVARRNRTAREEVPLDAAPGSEEALVRVDKRRLERVLTNLMDNADKHGDGLVGVRVSRTDGSATIAVDDAGPGVPPAERARVFERFARGSRSGRASSEGSGLGLSLVQRHLTLMNGSVSVGDSPAGGARFVVVLPVEEQQ